jgi:hypothetical protein
MANRRLNCNYPDPASVAATVSRNRTSLEGTRAFMASENLAVFAEEKVGMAHVAGEVWLRPSASRRMGNFLDTNIRHAAGGFRLQRAPNVRPLPGTVPANLFEHFRQVAETTKRKVVDNPRKLALAGCEYDDSEAWPWHGWLSYERPYTFEGGYRVVNEWTIHVHARQAPNGDVDIAAVLNRPQEFEAVQKWLNDGCRPTMHGWLTPTVGLPADAASRAEAFASVLNNFTAAEVLKVTDPDIHPREQTTDAISAAKQRDAFLTVMKQAPYKTYMAGLT